MLGFHSRRDVWVGNKLIRSEYCLGRQMSGERACTGMSSSVLTRYVDGGMQDSK